MTNREREICAVLQGLINGIDYETGEAYDFSETVIDSLKAVSTILSCEEQAKIQENKVVTEDSVHSVVDLAYKMFGVNFHEAKGRLAKPGWFYTGDSQTRCQDCNNQLEIFRKPYNTSAKQTYHYYALVCAKCSTITTPNELPDEDRSRLYKEHKMDVPIYSDEEEYTQTENPPIENQTVNTDDLAQNPCQDCEKEIPIARLVASPDAVRCVSCQSEFEKANPELSSRKIEEKGILTREGAKRMRAKQYGTNIRNKI